MRRPTTPHECQVLACSMVEWSNAEMACFLGMLIAVYREHPNALFWDVLTRFSMDRVQARIIKP